MNTIILNNIKFKPISEDKLLFYTEKLFKFKKPTLKIKKVFLDIINKYLISPKLNLDYYILNNIDETVNIVETVWNSSVYEIYKKDYEYSNVLVDDLNSIFVLSDYEKKMFGVKIILKPLLEKLKLEIKIPTTKKLILTEGITEQLLLPRFAQVYGYDFSKNNVQLVQAGGKNQVAKYYLDYINYVKIPIVILLDNDAKQIYDILSPKIRKTDKMILLPNGEFEDLLLSSLIKKAINSNFKNVVQIELSDIDKNISKVEALEKLYRVKCLGDFQKGEFAKLVQKSISNKTHLSKSIVNLLEIIKKV
ncbi:MAG: ATP-dependent endonuclease [Candidatus Gastranaerophilales bacterium]|nr:ATP-dependent endonuclease [Candidatus Gastranaerophilales bacterium]